MWGVAAVITCTILPSAVAFTSLVSAAGVPSAAAYGLISLGRLTLTSGEKLEAKWSLGQFRVEASTGNEYGLSGD